MVSQAEINKLKVRWFNQGYSPLEVNRLAVAHVSGGPKAAVEEMRKIEAERMAREAAQAKQGPVEKKSIGYVASGRPDVYVENEDDEVTKLKRKKKRNPQADLGLAWLKATDRSKRKKIPQTKV